MHTAGTDTSTATQCSCAQNDSVRTCKVAVFPSATAVPLLSQNLAAVLVATWCRTPAASDSNCAHSGCFAGADGSCTACPSVRLCVYALRLLLQVIPQQCEDGLKARTESSTVAWLVDKVGVCQGALQCRLLNVCSGQVAALPCLHAWLQAGPTKKHACALRTHA